MKRFLLYLHTVLSINYCDGNYFPQDEYDLNLNLMGTDLKQTYDFIPQTWTSIRGRRHHAERWRRRRPPVGRSPGPGVWSTCGWCSACWWPPPPRGACYGAPGRSSPGPAPDPRARGQSASWSPWTCARPWETRDTAGSERVSKRGPLIS